MSTMSELFDRTVAVVPTISASAIVAAAKSVAVTIVFILIVCPLE
jgi:hypothetical protein